MEGIHPGEFHVQAANIFGTASVHLRMKKNGFQVPKRHQTKHLDFLIPIVRDQRVGGNQRCCNSWKVLSGTSTDVRRGGFQNLIWAWAELLIGIAITLIWPTGMAT